MSSPRDGDELRAYGEYREVLTPERPKDSQQGLTQIRPHLRHDEQLVMMLRAVRLSSPKSTWLGVTNSRLLLVNSGTLTFDAAWEDLVLEPLSSGLRVHPDGDKPFKIAISGARGANLEGLLAMCRSCQEGLGQGTAGADDLETAGLPDEEVGGADVGSGSQAVSQVEKSAVSQEGKEKAPSSIVTIIDGLRELADLHAQGVLSDEEFAAMKSRLLEGD